MSGPRVMRPAAQFLLPSSRNSGWRRRWGWTGRWTAILTGSKNAVFIGIERVKCFFLRFFSSKCLYIKKKYYLCTAKRKTKCARPNAQVAELVDAHVSGACAARCAGSSPALGTKIPDSRKIAGDFFLLLPQPRENCPTPRREDAKVLNTIYTLGGQGRRRFSFMRDMYCWIRALRKSSISCCSGSLPTRFSFSKGSVLKR